MKQERLIFQIFFLFLVILRRVIARENISLPLLAGRSPMQPHLQQISFFTLASSRSSMENPNLKHNTSDGWACKISKHTQINSFCSFQDRYFHFREVNCLCPLSRFEIDPKRHVSYLAASSCHLPLASQRSEPRNQHAFIYCVELVDRIS